MAEQVPTDPELVAAEEFYCALSQKAMGKELAVRIKAEKDKLFRVLPKSL